MMWYERKLRVGNLPLDYGETQAKKTMERLENTIRDILYGDHEKLDSYHFNEHFIKSVKDREKQKSIEINDLNQLDELISLEEAKNFFKMRKVLETYNMMEDINGIIQKININYLKYTEENKAIENNIRELFNFDDNVDIYITRDNLIRAVGDFYMGEHRCEILQGIQDVTYTFSRWNDVSELRINIK